MCIPVIGLLCAFSIAAPPTPAELGTMLYAAGWPSHLIAEASDVARYESRVRMDTIGADGEIGIFQVRPGTWAGVFARCDLAEVFCNLHYGARIADYGRRHYGDHWRDWTCKPRRGCV